MWGRRGRRLQDVRMGSDPRAGEESSVGRSEAHCLTHCHLVVASVAESVEMRLRPAETPGQSAPTEQRTQPRQGLRSTVVRVAPWTHRRSAGLHCVKSVEDGQPACFLPTTRFPPSQISTAQASSRAHRRSRAPASRRTDNGEDPCSGGSFTTGNTRYSTPYSSPER
jgi:hypothetical protein